jgi:hypothetical protein
MKHCFRNFWILLALDNLQALTKTGLSANLLCPIGHPC